MFNTLEEESRRLAAKQVGDCKPEDAQLILDSIQENILIGCELVFEEILVMCHNGSEIESIIQACYDAKRESDLYRTEIAKKYNP
jgi:hypothetical protein